MAKKQAKPLADYIEPLYMNGLRGRMLRLPPPKGKNKEILFIYGHHASLERMIGFAEAINKYGAVTMPDLPGFGGMESFYKIGMKPSIDNLADYLASFIKLRYKRRRVTIVGLSLGFAIITRMLQKYPELCDRVDLLVSLVGFVHKDDFILKPETKFIFRYGSSIFSNRLPAWVAKHIFFRPFLIKTTYRLVADKHVKFKDADEEERNRRYDFEVKLWQINDMRTYMDTAVSMFKLDLCSSQIDLPVYHVAVRQDHFFDNNVVEQHMRVIYKDFTEIISKKSGHSQTVLATAEDVAPFFPRKLRSLLNRK